jgi:hypothetical protein
VTFIKNNYDQNSWAVPYGRVVEEGKDVKRHKYAISCPI